jgi:putative DNA primase/helicase
MKMDKNDIIQELNLRADLLATQRRMREEQLVTLILNRIAEDIVSHETDILKLMADGKGQHQNAVREVVVREVKQAADSLLWCPEYVERAKSDQQVLVFTGSHWQVIEAQLWKDFVGHCATRCGVPESLVMNPVFMRALYESTAFNVAEHRRQLIPDGEVWLNMRNGTLVIRCDGSVTLQDHRKEDLFRYTLPYSYDPQADCPLWQKFLDRVQPQPDAQLLLAEFIGYILMPGHELEKMLLLYGEGLNGKSVTMELIEALLGSVNVSYLSLSDLTNDDVKRAGIEHKMLNISHESGKDVNPNVLKQLTSGERITIKNLYRDPRETNDYGKLIAAFNILPRAENSFGFFRRLIILAYQVTIPKEEIDRQLATKLKDELPGILNWVLKALPPLMKRREFSPCESSEKALEMYRLQSDNVRLFINEACEASDYTTPASELYTAYRNYCIGSSLKPIGKNRFISRLESLGYEPVVYAKVKYFKLKATEQ